MLREGLQNSIEQHFGKILDGAKALHGGDINEVFLVNTTSGPVVVKTNRHPYPGMFPAEARGLEALSKAQSFRVPEVLHTEEDHLILEYIPQGDQPTVVSGEKLGQALAGLHQCTASDFGFDQDNYIGSLPQSNKHHSDGVSFYREERLLPQFKLARDKGFTFRELDTFLLKLDEIIPEEPASLIHGDLWGGNYMVSEQGEPCLIDPAVCYANREMDLAMMALFGGFPKGYAEAYNELFPLPPAWRERIPLWQLYYILVHLNLFGAGYYSRTMQIIKTYL